MNITRTRKLLKWLSFGVAFSLIVGLVAYFYVQHTAKSLAESFPLLIEKHLVFGTLLVEVQIAQAVQQHFKERGSLPHSVNDLKMLTDSQRVDPWGSPFVVKQLTDDRFVVQSFGPTRKDMLDDAALKRLETEQPSSWEDIHGNIILVAAVSEPVRLQTSNQRD